MFWPALALLAANLATLAIALWLDWRPREILWVYLLQSVVVGFFAVVRLLGLGVAARTLAGPLTFFTFLHLLLAGALAKWQGFDFGAGMALCAFAFFVQSALDHRRDRRLDATAGTPDATKIMLLALARTLPLFLMFMAAVLKIGNSRQEIVVLLCFKTVADAILHSSGSGDARAGPPAPDFTLLGVEVYLPFNRNVVLALLAALAVAGYFFHVSPARAADAAVASSRNWRVSIDSIACESSLLTIGARIDYLGPKGPVEAPVNRLVDAERQYLPRSLVWKGGDKRLSQWLTAGGIANLRAERVGEFQFKFDVGAAAGALQFEFGDIRAFSVTSKGGCRSVLKPAQLATPRKEGLRKAEPLKSRVYRAAYPCTPQRTIEADHPPYLPRQLVLLGHGFLPSAREIDLPMGRAPAQPYVYNGVDDLAAVEGAARQAIAADFPQYWNGKFFFFNWATQKSLSGNDIYSIGIYEVRPCP